jgi:hypothetical protein
MNQKYMFIGILAMALLVYGCPNHSINPLSSVESARIDDSLLGTWEFRENDNVLGTMQILKFNEHEVVILANEQGKGVSDVFRAFTTEIEGERFINLQRLGGKEEENRKWLFANYSIVGDEMKYKLVSDKLFDNEVLSSREIRHLVAQNLRNNVLYEGGNLLYRLKER